MVPHPRDIIDQGGQLDMNSNKIANVQNPSNAQDAATKSYVDNNDGTGTDDQTLSEVLTQGNSAGSNSIYMSGNDIVNTGILDNTNFVQGDSGQDIAFSSGNINLRDTSNNNVLRAKDGGNVDIPNGNLDITGSLSVGGTECPDDEALLGDGTCGSIGGGGGTQNLSEVLAAGNVANQSIVFSNGIEIGDSGWTVASYPDAVAVGKRAEATDSDASAFGYGADATDNYASAFGSYADADGFDTSAFGSYASASANRASAFGPNADASGSYALAFGSYADASAEGAVAIGHGAYAPNSYEATFGHLGNQYYGGPLDVNVTGDLTVHGNSNVYGSKNFVQQVNESHEVVYTSQESADVRAVVEDTAEVVNGTAVVELPDHFSKTVSDRKSELKVQVTPNSVNTYGLAVINRSDDQIAVKELMGGSHSFEFDYRVTGIRESYENKTVVREIEKSENAASAPAT